MSPLMSVYDQMPDGFPRVSGDEPANMAAIVAP